MVLVPALNPCSGELPGVPPTRRFSQPTRSLGARVGVLHLLHRGEVGPVGHRQAGRVHGRHLARLPQRLEGGHRRVQAEHAVLPAAGRPGTAMRGRAP